MTSSIKYEEKKKKTSSYSQLDLQKMHQLFPENWKLLGHTLGPAVANLRSHEW